MLTASSEPADPMAGGGADLVVDWDGMFVLTTPRLLLRTFRRDDLPHYAALNADPEAELEEDGVPFHAVVHAITRDRWGRRAERR